MAVVEVLTSRLLLRPTDPARSHGFYRDVLGLAVHREFGPPGHRGVVYLTGGGGLLEVSGSSATPPTGLALWLQVRDVRAEHERLAPLGVVTRAPVQEPWGLVECWLADPDGVPVVLVEIPADHPLRRDQR